jgi:hypothetical protein
VIAVMSGLLQLAQHARDRAAAGGNALVRAQVFPVSPMRPTGLGHTRFRGFADPRGSPALITQPSVAEAAAALDDLAQPCPGLVAASALLADEIGQAFHRRPGTREQPPALVVDRRRPARSLV